MLTCHPDKFKSRMFPSKIVNLSFFLSQALGQLPWGPGFGLCAPRRAATPWFLSCAARFEGRSLLKKAAPKTFIRLRAFGPAARTRFYLSLKRGLQPPVSPAGSVGPERSPLGTRTPRRDLRAQALAPRAEDGKMSTLSKKPGFMRVL